MNKEIGGYFELGGFEKKLYHKNALAINTARNCLIYLIKSRNIKKIYVPYYLCDSINNATKYCEVEYYKIDHFLPAVTKELKNNEYIYIVNYFGLISNYKIMELKKIYKNIIIDNVQAFFQKPVNNVDTIYSCRKFFCVPDGAYLYTKKIMLESMEQDSSIDRFKHIIGRVEKGAEKYYDEYRKNEELLNQLSLQKMSQLTQLILKGMNYKKIKNIRTKNFKYLNHQLKKINNFTIKDVKGAYAYPLYIKDASRIKKVLINSKVYIPTLWPNVIKENKDNIACEYALKILPLPCDQRYGIEEMKRIVKIIKECY